jgi:hypothetical protein
MRRIITTLSVLVIPAAAAAQSSIEATRAVREASPDLVVSLVGGVEGFIGKSMRDAVGPGAAWGVRASYGNHESVRAEVAYLGSAQPLRGTDASVMAHGVVGQFRINVFPDARVEPFFFMGVGWARFSASAMGGLSAREDDVFMTPIGVGAAYRIGAFVVDARFALTVATAPDLVDNAMPAGSEDSEMMHRLGITTAVGYAF